MKFPQGTTVGLITPAKAISVHSVSALTADEQLQARKELEPALATAFKPRHLMLYSRAKV